MATPATTQAQAKEAFEAIERHGGLGTFGSIKAASEETGINKDTLRRRALKHKDPALTAAQMAVGSDGSTPISSVWAKTDSEGNTSYSVLLRPESKDAEDFKAALSEIIESTVEAANPKLPERFKERDGCMLVLDPADVHIGKLCRATETGYEYSAEVAEHRLVEGCKSLVDRGKANGASHVLFVIGNDISHIDNAQKKTTSGTPQDVSHSVFDILRIAERAYVRAVEAALEAELTVTIAFCPSNHDWVLGFCIARTLAAWFGNHPNVTASDYSVSERHRKYVRFGNNLILLSHGDGAKDADLPQIMLREAREHIADCPHLYAYLHHYHHKIKKHLGIRPTAREKDHIAMTVMRAGAGEMEGDNVKIEHVRSPSPPDSWHDRNGYVNRQAVEAFLHHPTDGQTMRFTEWF